MALKYASTALGTRNWSDDTGTWVTTSGGAIPTTHPVAGDTARLGALSGPVNVDVNSACTSLDGTSYTSVLTQDANITLSASTTKTFLLPAGTYAHTPNASLTFTGTNLTINVASGSLPGIIFQAGGSKAFSVASSMYYLEVAASVTANIASNNISISGLPGDGSKGLTLASGSKVGGSKIITLSASGPDGITWSGSGSVNGLGLTINSPSGPVTISGDVHMGALNQTLTYVSGNVVSTGSTLNVDASMNMSGWADVANTLNNVEATTSLTINLLTAGQVITGDLINSSGLLTLGVNGISVGGNLTLSGDGISASGLTITMSGAGTWSGSGTLESNLTFDATGDLVISGTVYFTSGTITYINSASTDTRGSTLSILGDCSFDTPPLQWGVLHFPSASVNITLLDYLNCTWLILYYYNVTFSGSNGVWCDYLVMESGKTLIIPAGQNLTVVSGMQLSGSQTFATTLRSSSAASSSGLIYNGTYADSRVYGMTFTDIDASSSIVPIRNYCGGTLTRTENIFNITPDLPVFPAQTDVRTTIIYGPTGTEYTGSCSVPSASNVILGVAVDDTTGTFDESSRNTDPGVGNVIKDISYKIINVDKTGTFDESARNTDPGVGNVRSGVSYKILNSDLTGTYTLVCDYPAITDVRSGISFGYGTLTGNMTLPTQSQTKDGVYYGAAGTEYLGNVTLPAVGDVKLDVAYGSSGTEFTGTLDVADSSDLQDQVNLLRTQLLDLQNDISIREKKSDVNTLNTLLSSSFNTIVIKLTDLEECVRELQGDLIDARHLLITHTH